MNLKLARLFLIIIPVSLTAFSWPNIPPSIPETNLSFKDFQVISVKDKEVQLKAITDNSGVKQVTNIEVKIDGGNMAFTISVLPNDRNVTINYKGSIKLNQ